MPTPGQSVRKYLQSRIHSFEDAELDIAFLSETWLHKITTKTPIELET